MMEISGQYIRNNQLQGIVLFQEGEGDAPGATAEMCTGLARGNAGGFRRDNRVDNN